MNPPSSLLVHGQNDAQSRLKLYGRRKGRPLSAEMQSALDSGLEQFGIDRTIIHGVPAHSIAAKDFFPSTVHRPPLTGYWLEIGFGGGDFIAAQSALNPDIGLIGCEAYENGIAKTAQKLLAQKSDNVRIYPDDARHLLPKLQNASLDAIFLLFPDPWPKARHAKRRFVNPDNLAQLARVIEPGGKFWVASDHDVYRAWVVEQMMDPAQIWFKPEHPGDIFASPPPAGWVTTGYQRKAIRAGRDSKFACFSKI